MSSLLDHVRSKVLRLRVPFSVHLDLTWRCNEDCIHCYLDHSSSSELDTAEVKELLGQLAGAGTLFLLISGGDPFLRPDLLEIVRHARSLLFSVTIKTNGLLLGEPEAAALARLDVAQVHISVYSHRPEVHDAITRVPGSLYRSLDAIRRLVRHSVKTRITDVLMDRNAIDYPGVHALAVELGAECMIDPSLTPALDDDPVPVSLRLSLPELALVYRDPIVVSDVDKFCAPPAPPEAATLDGFLCGAGHSACYISPAGVVMPCVQFPIVCGNLRRRKFIDVWRSSPELNHIRGLRTRDLPVCRDCAAVAGCSRCPGVAYMAGDLLGPSLLDCEKTYARTGVRGSALPS